MLDLLLITGIFVKIRNGDIGIVFGDKILFNFGYIRVREYFCLNDNNIIMYVDETTKHHYTNYDIIGIYNITIENCDKILNYEPKIRCNGEYIQGIECLNHLTLDSKLNNIANSQCCIWKEGK